VVASDALIALVVLRTARAAQPAEVTEELAKRAPGVRERDSGEATAAGDDGCLRSRVCIVWVRVETRVTGAVAPMHTSVHTYSAIHTLRRRSERRTAHRATVREMMPMGMREA